MHCVSSLKCTAHIPATHGKIPVTSCNQALEAQAIPDWLLCGFRRLWLDRSMRRGDSNEGWRSKDYYQPQAFPLLSQPSSSLECTRCLSHWCSSTIWPRFPESNQDPLLPTPGFSNGELTLLLTALRNSYLPTSEWRIHSFLISSNLRRS